MAMLRVGQTFAGSKSGLDGSEVLQPGCGLMLYNSSLEMTMFRPLPEVDSNGQLLPWCTPEGYMTEWLYPIARDGKGRLVQSAGQNRRISFDCDPADCQGLAETPYERLYRIAIGRWPSLGERRTDRGPIIPATTAAFLVQCVLYIRAGKKGSKGGPTPQSPKTNVVLTLPQTAYSATTRLLMAKDQSGAAMIPDFMSPTSPGALLLMSHNSPIATPMGWQLQVCSEPMVQHQQMGDGGSFTTKYQAGYVVPNYGQMANAGIPAPYIPSEEYCRKAWVPWNRVVRRLTVEEQVKLISTAFDAAIIVEAFRDSEFAQYVPDAIMRSGSTSVAMGGQASPGNVAPVQQFTPPVQQYTPPQGPPVQQYAPPVQQYTPPQGPPAQQFTPPVQQYTPPQGPPAQQFTPPVQQYTPPVQRFTQPPSQVFTPSVTQAPAGGPPPQHSPTPAPPVQQFAPSVTQAPAAGQPMQYNPQPPAQQPAQLTAFQPSAPPQAAPAAYPGAVNTPAFTDSLARLDAVRAKMQQTAAGSQAAPQGM